MRTLRFGALSALLSLISLVGTASADNGPAAVLPFQGPQASKVRQMVQKGLRNADVQLVPLKQVTAVVRKTKGYAKQAAKLKASVLVRTRVRRVEGRWIADTEVRNAKGQRVEKARVGSSSIARLSSRIVGQLMKTGRMPTGGAAAITAAAEAKAAPAAPTQPRLVIRPFTGVQAGKIRGAAVRGLRSESVELFPNKQFVAKAKSQGVNLKSDGGHVVPASALAVSGLIEGDVLHEDGVWSAYVRLVDGESATVVSQHFYDASTSAALARSVQTNVGPDFRKDIKKLGVTAPRAVAAAPIGAATAAPAEQPSKKKDKAETKSKTKTPRGDRPAAVDIEIDFRMVHRDFTFKDDLRGNLRDYKLQIGPGVGIKFQYYPGAHFTAGVGAQFGIDFEWERLFKFDSTRVDGAKFPTESQQFLVGLRWRYPKGRWEPSVVVDYGVHSFNFGVSGPPVPGEDNTAGIPNVKYEFVRIGGGFRVGIGKKEIFIITTNVAFRGVFSVGAIGTDLWFPEAKANGMDALLMFGFALPKGFEIRLSGDYRRYWFDLNPVPPDPPYVAGGALDQYWGGAFGLAWRR
jgi:ribosomal protein L12E/L44/L45/RPP1/RPP2